VSGFIGYMLLGLYLRRFVGELSWKKTLAVGLPCWLAGFFVVFGGFLRRVYETSGGVFPTGGKVDVAVYWETTWCNDTIGVALMTIGAILLFKKIKCDGGFYKKVLLPISQASYGMYLSHLLVLVPISGFVSNWLGSGADGKLGVMTTPVEIILSAVSAFVLVALGSIVIRKIPRIGKFIIG
jgi:surface polysaccharide O-acyltransferase-like enzyme